MSFYAMFYNVQGVKLSEFVSEQRCEKTILEMTVLLVIEE